MSCLLYVTGRLIWTIAAGAVITRLLFKLKSQAGSQMTGPAPAIK